MSRGDAQTDGKEFRAMPSLADMRAKAKEAGLMKLDKSMA